MRDMYKGHATGERVRDRQQQWEIKRDMQQLHGTERDSEKQPVKMRDIKRSAATQ